MRNIDQIIEYLNKKSMSDGKIEQEDIQKITDELTVISAFQSNILCEIKNENIRIENKIRFIENEIEKNRVFKSILDNILERTNRNPISALMYFYRIKKNIEKLMGD